MTKKPRITITLDPNSYAILQRLSLLGGQSMSAIVTDFLDIGLPSMERLVVVLEQAKNAPGQTREGVLAAIDRAERAVLPAMVAALKQPDMFLAEAVRQSETQPATNEGAQRTRAGVGGSRTPVLVTRGSGRLKVPPRVPAKGGKHGPL